MRHITDRHHLEALVLAGFIQALLTMAMLSAIGETEKNLHLSLEKFHQAIGMVLLNLKLQSPDISLPDQGMDAPVRPEIAEAFGSWLDRLQFRGEGYRDGRVFRTFGIVHVTDLFESRK